MHLPGETSSAQDHYEGKRGKWQEIASQACMTGFALISSTNSHTLQLWRADARKGKWQYMPEKGMAVHN